MEELKNFIANNSAKLEKQINESQSSIQKSLEDKIDKLANKVNEEIALIKSTVDTFKVEISTEMSDMKTQLNKHKNNIAMNTDAIQRMERNHILRLAGFKYKTNENLLACVTKVANDIGFNTFSQTIAPKIERIPSNWHDVKFGYHSNPFH